MKKYRLKYSLVLIGFFLALPCGLFSQIPKGDFTDFRNLPNKDTVRYFRAHGKYWLGAFGGINTNAYFGNLAMPRNPRRDQDQTNKLLDFSKGWGGGLFLGIEGDFLPPGEIWGAGLRLAFLDYRYSASETTPLATDPTKQKFEAQIGYNYITMSPFARYTLPIGNIFLMGGVDLEFLASYNLKYINQFNDTGSVIKDTWKLAKEPNSFRVGVNLGVGFDMYIVDIDHRMRVYLSPFAQISSGTSIFSEWGSSRNSVLLRTGVTVRLGYDDVRLDTMRFDPTYVPPPIYLASGRSELPVSVPEMAYVAKSIGTIEAYSLEKKIEVATSGTPAVSIQELPPTVVPEVKKTKKEYTVSPNKTERLQFESSPSKSQQEILDAIVEYMKKNGSARLQIVGHSDNQGTTAQIEKKAKDRAMAVVKYLEKKGIPRRRLLYSDAGSRQPYRDNRTAEGQKANRRVEIVILPK